ncbi:MAG: acyltransferase family protein [Lachnospiraceae bacterium]|nr:acyltransferase family protein [Lachnospiraceae bacterium]
MSEHNKHIFYLSYIRAFACVAIVFLHTYTMEAMYYRSEINPDSYAITNCVAYMMMWAVPCFVMVTGALLLNPDKDIPLKKLYGRYILRIIITLLLFTTVFTISDIIYNKEKLNIFAVIKRTGYKFFTNSSWAHMWYLYLMIGLYVLLPVFRALVKELDTKNLYCLLIAYFVFNSVIPLINQFADIKLGFYITTNSIFPFYLIMGYMINNNLIKIDTKLSALLFAVGEALIIILSILGIKNNNADIVSLLGNYSFVPVCITSIGAFGFFRNIKINKPNKFILTVDKLSFGIYLVHLGFLRYGIKSELINPYKYGGNLFIIVIVLIVFGLSFVLSYLLRLIPGIKKLL